MSRGRPSPSPRVVVATVLSLGVMAGTVLGCLPARSAAPEAAPSISARRVRVDVDGAADEEARSAAPAPAAATTPAVDARYVQAAGACPGLDPAVLAAIHTVETHQAHDRSSSSAGALGPMQFLPATWARYGTDGNGDGRADIHDLADALSSAARLLCANGGSDPQRLPSAVWHYNHSHVYVSVVLRLAGLR